MKKQLPRRLFDVDEYHRMAEVGILTADERVELIDGEIIEMSPIGPRHNRCVIFLTDIFVRRLQGQAIVSPGLSLRLHRHSEPQPDLALLRPPLAKYGAAIPAADDVVLVIEVADTSQYRDRIVKLPRYADAGVVEVWIVDLPARAVDVYRDPAPGRYRFAQRVLRGAEIAPAAFPDLSLAVDDILG
jgi:Uma2 family endonuclease